MKRQTTNLLIPVLLGTVATVLLGFLIGWYAAEYYAHKVVNHMIMDTYRDEIAKTFHTTF